jgi:hypothetical protein
MTFFLNLQKCGIGLVPSISSTLMLSLMNLFTTGTSGSERGMLYRGWSGLEGALVVRNLLI